MGRPARAGDAQHVATDEIEVLARQRLGFAELRPGQLPAVEALVAGRDVLAVLPTGAGKSAIYELAGLLRPGPTVVLRYVHASHRRLKAAAGRQPILTLVPCQE